MRYFKLRWLSDKPSDAELLTHLNRTLGSLGVTLGNIRVNKGVVSSNNKWSEKLRGALALKWQFTAKVTSTKKGLESVDVKS